MSECTHTSVTDIEGDSWTDSQGKLHTVIKSKCANPFCARYGLVVRVRQTAGDETPTRYQMPPYMPGGVKP